MNYFCKKVCILSTAHEVTDARIFYKEAKLLAKAGYDVSIVIPHDKDEVLDGIKVFAINRANNRFIRMSCVTINVFFRGLEQHAEIYHIHDPDLLFVTLILKMLTGAKIIYDVHEDYPKSLLSREYMPKFIRSWFSVIFNWIEKNVARYYDCIFAATVSIANNFKSKNVVLLPNFPDIDRFSAVAKETRDILNINKNYTLIYCGGLTRIRGIREIISSLGFINSAYAVKLKLAGRFDDPKFEREIKSLEEWKMVDYLGYISKEEVIKNFYEADCGLVCLWPEPNHVSSLGDKLLEYMLVGLPVIASNFPLWKSIINDANCGICVNPLCPEEIAKAIVYLIEHSAEAEKMGQNGRKAVLEKYNWKKEYIKLLNVYKNLITS